jgi:SAM-dependent methyltransferase
VPELRPYYAKRGLSARYYDLITRHDASLEGDIALYACLAPPGGEFLELGAGTGRVAFALAELGFAVHGIDIAPAMLALAEEKRARLAPDLAGRVTFQLGDMAALDLGRTFDAVVCPFFGLAHLPGGAAWRATFRVMARHLKPGGLCATHLPLAELMAAPAPDDLSRPLARLATDAAGGALEIYLRERRYNLAVRRMDQILDYVVTGPTGSVENRSFERQTFYAADPIPFAAAAGLTPDRPPQRLGRVGDVHVFRKADPPPA